MPADIINTPVSTVPTQAWTGVRGSANTVLVWNSDIVNTVYVGFNTNVSVGSPSAIPVPPNGSFNLPASRNIFVIGTVKGVAPLVIIPDATGMFRSITQGLGALAVPSVFSPGFISGVVGWIIRQDGSAEFQDLVLRGSFFGNNYELLPQGSFWYSGAPAAGNLSASIVGGLVNVADDHGNVALPGQTVYQTPLALNSPAFNVQAAIVTWYIWNGANWAVGPSVDWTLANGFIEFLGAGLRSLSGTRANPTIISSDSWTSFTAFGPGFQAGGFTPQQVYMPTGPNNAGSVRLRGQIVANAATAANSTMVVAMGPPTQAQSWITPTNASGYTVLGSRVITIDVAGNVRLQPAASNTNFVLLDGIEFSLG